MRQKIIAGNWKMFKTIPEAKSLVKQLFNRIEKNPLKKTKVIVCPPFISLISVYEIIKGSKLLMGAQNLFWEEEGAYTGEISATMIKNAGARYVIIGHSERRAIFGEDENTINRKIKLALKNGLKVILCVGETLEHREQGLTQEIVVNQMEWDLKNVKEELLKNVIIAYEPVWAIGTGRTATPKQAQEVHAAIRIFLDALFSKTAAKKMTILYGGSVKPGNADGLLSQPDIDGALVGGACLVAKDFWKIIQASEKVA
jgi:triosephosphate isomerase